MLTWICNSSSGILYSAINSKLKNCLLNVTRFYQNASVLIDFGDETNQTVNLIGKKKLFSK